MDPNTHNSWPRSEFFVLSSSLIQKNPQILGKILSKPLSFTGWSAKSQLSPGLFENGLKLVTGSVEYDPKLDHKI